MKVILSIVALVFFSMVYAELSPECQEKADALETCVEGQMGEGPSEEELAERAAKDAAKSKCLTDNGCEDVHAQRTEARECRKEVMEKTIIPALEQCTGETFPEFLKKKMCGGHRRGHGHGRGGFGRRHGRKSREDRLKEACPTDEAASSALECLEGLREEGRGRRGRRGGRFEKMRALRQCFQDVGDCRDEIFEDIKAKKDALCECAKTDVLGNIEINMEFAACDPEEEPEEGEEEEGAVEEQSQLQRMVDRKFCSTKGPGFRGFGGHGGGRGHGHGRRRGRGRGRRARGGRWN